MTAHATLLGTSSSCCAPCIICINCSPLSKEVKTFAYFAQRENTSRTTPSTRLSRSILLPTTISSVCILTTRYTRVESCTRYYVCLYFLTCCYRLVLDPRTCEHTRGPLRLRGRPNTRRPYFPLCLRLPSSERFSTCLLVSHLPQHPRSLSDLVGYPPIRVLNCLLSAYRHPLSTHP